MDDDGGFAVAFERTVGHEGGYVNDPADPGGETKYGISKRSYPRLDIRALTLDDARRIYRRDFWGPAGCPLVHEWLRALLFDAAVHHGPTAARKMLQAAVGEVEDGILGPRTLQALRDAHPARVAAHLLGERLDLMTDLSTWKAFGRGWAKRIAGELRRV